MKSNPRLRGSWLIPFYLIATALLTLGASVVPCNSPLPICFADEEPDNLERRYSCFGVNGMPQLGEELQRRLGREAPQAGRGYTVLLREAFATGYSEADRIPLWTAYCLSTDQGHTGSRSSYRVDQNTKARVRPDAFDHRTTGMTRGHMAPNYAIRTRYGRSAQAETFLMSNMCPQLGNFNGGIWLDLERRIAGPNIAYTWANEQTEVWVLCGPIIGDGPRRLASKVVVPKEFYKIIIRDRRNSRFDGRESEILAFRFPHDASSRGKPLSDYLTTVDAIEAATGCDFFSQLEDTVENELESRTARAIWGTASWER